jgi:FXSXX-COOH protein
MNGPPIPDSRGDLVSGVADLRLAPLGALADAQGTQLNRAVARALESSAGRVLVAAFNSSV